MHLSSDKTAARILIVDSDPGIRSAISEFLYRNGYDVDTAADGREMDRAIERRPADVVVLDIMQPSESGLSLRRRLVRPGGPSIIVLSAERHDVDRIIGAELAADQYLPKPCNPRELLARVRAVLRQRFKCPNDQTSDASYEFEGWTLNLGRRELCAPDGVEIGLSGGDLSLLRVFVENPRRLLSRDRLREQTEASRSTTSNRAIDARVGRLRAKFGKGGEWMIQTARGEGYTFVPKVTRLSETGWTLPLRSRSNHEDYRYDE